MRLACRLAVEPRVLDRHRRLPREGLGELLVFRAERATRAEAQDSDDAITHAQRHHEERRVAQVPVEGGVLGHDVRRRREIGGDRPPFLDHLAAQALPDPDARRRHRLGRVADGARQHELVAFEETEAGVVHAEEPRGFVADEGEQRIGRRERADLRVDLEQRPEVRAPHALLREDRRPRDRETDLIDDRLEEPELFGCERPFLGRDRRQHAPRPAVDEDRQRQLRAMPAVARPDREARRAEALPGPTASRANGRS